MSVMPSGGTFRTSDELRPPALGTFDMRGDVLRTLRFLNGLVPLGVADLASDSDNDWADSAAVDAHAYAGWVYDYYLKRFGRAGIDDRNMPVLSLVHPARRDDIRLVDTAGRRWNFTSGALDIVAHELTHGVTDFTSQLIYRNESGALNEAFSDVMATGVEFYFQAPGDGPMRAEYLMGEDVITPGGIRSMANPGAFGDPDHYSTRFRGAADNGGVHINSGIVNQAYYLAIEGGTNRTSGLSVQGVGGASREQMEKVFYRAFTALMPSAATFAVARAATLQSARDLYGAGSGPERALAAAWSAVGVE
jgi:thermolysin